MSVVAVSLKKKKKKNECNQKMNKITKAIHIRLKIIFTYFFFLIYFTEVCVFLCICFFFFFKQKTAYEISECDWSSDVCSSDLNSSHKQTYEISECDWS